MKAAIAISIAIIFGGLGDILLSKGMKSRGEVAIRKLSDIPPLIKMVFTNPFVILGVTSMAIYFGSYIAALAWVDVSIANPLTALSYALATLYAAFFMRETVSSKRWGGVLLVTLGAVFIGLSS